MADTYLNLQTTPIGRNMIVRSLYGDQITFTKIQIGNGVPGDLNEIEELANPVVDVSLTKAEPGEDADYLVLTGYISSSDIPAAFYGYELGVWAKGTDNVERLYAYRYNNTDVDYYPSSASGRALELTISVVVQLGNAENVNAILIEGDTYAAKADFDAHVEDMGNPHNVTAAQVGLGNVPNVSTNNQTPTFQQAASLSNITSGSTLSAIFGKIMKAIADLISHLSNTTMHITATERTSWNSKASGTHTHSATDINGGTLGVNRGGTGRNTITNGAILKGAGTSAVGLIEGTGALYATTKDNPVFGTLPVAAGGTGQTNLTNVTVGKANQLTTARSLKVALGSTTDVTFNGTGNCDSIPISGTLAVGHGGTGLTTLVGTDYTTMRVRGIRMVTSLPTSGLQNGEIILVYE